MALFEPLAGVRSMLELGNKRGTDGPGDTYKRHFEALGIRHVSVDWNGEDGALALDLRQPLDLGLFDMVSNVGTSEHVDDQVSCWRNIVESAAWIIVSITPAPGNWPGHGLHYPTEKFFEELAALNAFALQRCYTAGPPGRRFVYARLCRRDGLEEKRFTMPAATEMTAAPPRAPRRR